MFSPGAIWESKKSHTKVMVICATNLKTTEAMAKEYQPSIVSWDGHTFYSCSFERFLKVRQYVGQNKDFNSKFMAMLSLPIEPKEELYLDGLFSPFGTFFDVINNAQSTQSRLTKAKEQKSAEAEAETKPETKSEPETKPELAVTIAPETSTLFETKRNRQPNPDYFVVFEGDELIEEDTALLSRRAYSVETTRSPDSLSYVHAIKFDAQEDRKSLFKVLSKAQAIDTVSVYYLKENVATLESSGVLSISTGVEESGFFYKLELFEDAEDSAEGETEQVSEQAGEEAQGKIVGVSMAVPIAETETPISDLIEKPAEPVENEGLLGKVKKFFN